MSAVVADLDNSSTPQDTNTNTNAGAGEGGGVETNEGTPESNEQHGSNVVDVAGTSAGGVPVLSPKPVYGKGGVVAEVADDIAAAVDAFTVPTGFVRKGSRVDSFMYSLGVYVEQSAGAKHKYYCLASAECRRGRKEIPCLRGDRSNVNTHLKRKHGMQGTEGAKKDATRKEGQRTIRSALAASANSSLGKNRVRELLCAKMVVDKFLPFSFFSGNSWKDVMGLETADDTPYPALPSRRIKHLLVEMFVATKKAVMGNMSEEIKKALLPIVHYGVDLWTCKTSGMKFIDVHAFLVDSNFELRHVLLAVKHYAPSAAVQASEKASGVLFAVFRSLLAEFGIKLSDLAGGTTDSGSDIKAMCTNFLLAQHNVYWDWCVCHLADRAAEAAFGTSADPQKSKNKDARQVVSLIIKAAAKVNQSPIFKQKFDEAQMEMLGETLKISRHAPQRWLSLVRVMERIIRLWHVLRKVYANDGEEFPLDKDNNKDDILQLFSLLQPLAVITRDGQYGAVPMAAEMHMAFAELKKEVLDPDEPLKVFDIPATPVSPEAEQADEEVPKKKKSLPQKMVEPAALRPVATKTRELLTKTLVEKLYRRVWDQDSADPSPFRNASVLLTPSYKDTNFLQAHALTAADSQHLDQRKAHLAPTIDTEVDQKLNDCWADIKARALEAARKKHSARATGEGGQPPLKRLSTPATKARPRFASLARNRVRGDTEDVGEGDSEDKVLMQQVSQELERFQALYMTAEELDTREVLPWWRNTGRKMFPYLAPVAQQVLGNQAGAAQVERDFSSCANLLTRNRSRIDTYWVEMVMFLHVNYKRIPAFKDIPMIAAKDIRTCLPPRFNGGDADLAAAEAAFDVIENTNNSDIGV